MRPEFARQAELFPFQVEDAGLVGSRERFVLGHKTGMGKTVMALKAWSGWSNARTGLIVGSGAALAVWPKLAKDWGGIEVMPIEGDADDKKKLWTDILKSRDGIWITTYSMLQRLMAYTKGRPYFDVLINDELHKIRNRKTASFQCVRRIDSDQYIGMSATWASRGPQDLWSVLNKIDGRTFSSYWDFVRTFCFVERSPFGVEVFGVRNKEQLQKWMRGYYRSRSWEEVGYQMPPILRQIAEVDPTLEQKRMHEELDKYMMAELPEEGSIVTPSVLAKVTRLRQLCVTPALLSPVGEYGAGIEYLISAIEDDPHTVVFTPFAEAFPILGKALEGAGHKHVFELHGGIPTKQVQERLDQFKRTKGILLCTVAYAQAFAADTTHTAYFLGFSWDPNDNIQAEGRLRRIDSVIKSPVVAIYIINRDTIEEHVREVVNGKVRTIREVFRDYCEVMERRAT